MSTTCKAKLPAYWSFPKVQIFLNLQTILVMLSAKTKFLYLISSHVNVVNWRTGLTKIV